MGLEKGGKVKQLLYRCGSNVGKDPNEKSQCFSLRGGRGVFTPVVRGGEHP